MRPSLSERKQMVLVPPASMPRTSMSGSYGILTTFLRRRTAHHTIQRPRAGSTPGTLLVSLGIVENVLAARRLGAGGIVLFSYESLTGPGPRAAPNIWPRWDARPSCGNLSR